MATKWVYNFGDGKADGRAEKKNLLGGKGANLAEMASIGLPVPPGFTLTTEICTYFYQNDCTYPKELTHQVEEALQLVEKRTGCVFGDDTNPLLVSVRSGARASMPGMMDTVLNLGLNMARPSRSKFAVGNNKFVWSCPECPYVVEVSDCRLIPKRRYTHMKNHHEGRQVGRRQKSGPTLVAASSSTSLAWTCPYCSLGYTAQELDKYDPDTIRQTKALHWQNYHKKVPWKTWVKKVRQTLRCSKYANQQRITMLNCHIAKVGKLQQMKKRGFVGLVVPYLRPNRTGLKKFGLRRSWQCGTCMQIYRSDGPHVANHQCFRLDQTMQKRKWHTQLQQVRKWCQTHPEHGLTDLQKVIDDFEAVLVQKPSQQS